MKYSILLLSIYIISACNFVYGIGRAHNVNGIGFGSQTTGGSGGNVYLVTSLKDSEDGSLRYIIETSARPAIIKFSICGTIELKKRLTIDRGNLTIDGSDCEGGYGVQIKNYPVKLQNVKNVILSNIAFRFGTDAPMSIGQFTSSDPLEIQCSQDIVLNHLSIYWGTDENLSIYCYEQNRGNPSTRISLQHSVVAEALRSPKVLAPAEHSMGVLVDGKVNDITFYGNLFVSNADRNPRISPEGFSDTEIGTTHVQFINNMIYQTIYGLRTGGNSSNWQIKLDVIGNFVKNTSNNYQIDLNQKALFTHDIKSSQPVTAYIKNNLGTSRLNDLEPEINIFQYGYRHFGVESLNAAKNEANFRLSNSKITEMNKVPIIPAQHLEKFILANAGKVLPLRDPIDQKLIKNIKNDLSTSNGGQQAIDEAKDFMTNQWQCLNTNAAS